MDDILISHPSESTHILILADLTKDLEAWGLPRKGTKNASLSIFRVSYQWTLDLSSKGRNQEG
jgi:hypothetical protein